MKIYLAHRINKGFIMSDMYADKEQPEALNVVLPDHIKEGIYSSPPPSYEEVMGAQTLSSIPKAVTDLPPLAYVDIMPRGISPGNINREILPKFDSFSTVILTANRWLLDHPSYAVWKCEAVERNVSKNGNVDLNLMCHHQSTYGFNVYVTGVRLWLTLRHYVNEPPQQIGLLNFLPMREEVTDNRFAKLYGKRNTNSVPPVFRYTYEGLRKTVDRLNDMLRAKPLPGSIINIDLCVEVAAQGFHEAFLSPETTCRGESGSSVWRRHTQVLRVFYLLGPPAHEQVDMEVFMPALLSKPTEYRKAKYQLFSDVLDNAGKWLKSQTGIRVVNIISNNVKVEEDEKTGDVKLFPDDTDTFDLSMSSTLMDAGVTADNTEIYDFSMGAVKQEVRAIRIFFVKGMSGPFANIDMTSKLFAPVKSSGKTFESMSQTMFRIEAWLRLTGLHILSVETVCYLMTASTTAGIDAKNVVTRTSHNKSKDWVTAIRIYFATQFKEPPEDLLPPVSKESKSKRSATCSII